MLHQMMPSTADPIQQKMFLFMPIIFTFSFLWAPSGLVLYWLSSNLLAIGQRIDLADLKERIRKLEAIAAGVDL